MKKTLKTYLAIILISIILSNNFGLCLAANYNSKNQKVKYGKIYADETWNGNVYIVGDVIIPENVIVTIEAGTHLIFADYDIFKSGPDKSQCEIIVYGVLDTKSTPQNPIKVASTNQDNLIILPIDENTQILKFNPYKIETEKLREEFRSFRIQYLILWSIIYGMWILRR